MKGEAIVTYNKTVLDYFEKQSALTPLAPAVLIGDRIITYAELNSKSNQLARTLRSRGVKPNTVVGIMAVRSLEMIIGIIGIMKAGGAYLPLLPKGPAERTRYLLKESEAVLLLTQSQWMEDYGVPALDLQDSDLYQGSLENLEPVNHPEDLAYVIYTSGSTGKPKGVMIEHHSLLNRLVWMQMRYPIDSNDVILQKTPFIFDVSVWELLWWCMTGARLALLEPGYEKFPQAIIECIAKNHVTVMHFVPSMLSVFLNYVSEHDVTAKLASLRQVFASGETLTPLHVKRFNTILYAANATRLTNLYGPTEATVDVTYFDCPTEGEIERVPLGKPIDNIEIVIIDEQKTPVPVMETGELCIAGVGVARGYINNPTLTAEKFVAHPLRPQARMYRTGDLARWLPDGNIEFLGRADQQVKVRGIRIELEEIESVIAQFKEVDQCVVVTRQESETITLLTAYIVPKTSFSLSALKEYLRSKLPEYMIPDVFMTIHDIPLTPNGKVDRKLLTNLKKEKTR